MKNVDIKTPLVKSNRTLNNGRNSQRSIANEKKSH